MLKKITLLCSLVFWFSNAQAILISPPPSYTVTANLDLYDIAGQLIEAATADGRSLLTGGSVTFSSASLTSPFVVHDLSVISEIGPETVIGMQLDWGLSKNVYNEETWVLIIADDFMTGAFYYFYTSVDTDLDGVPGTQLSGVPYAGGPGGYPAGSQYLESGMTANITVSMSSVPLPASFWLFFSAILGGFAVRLRNI